MGIVGPPNLYGVGGLEKALEEGKITHADVFDLFEKVKLRNWTHRTQVEERYTDVEFDDHDQYASIPANGQKNKIDLFINYRKRTVIVRGVR